MGNSHFTFPSDLAEQWVQINSNGKLLIRNTISQQIFSMHRVPKNSSTDTKEYLRRSIYSLPHTPRILVLEENADSLYILAQQSLTQLKFLLRKKKLLIQVLQTIKDLILVAQQLKQKYGAFEIKQDQIGVLKNQQIFMWINSKFELNQIQFRVHSHKNEEEAMIASIVNICQKHCKFNLLFLLTTQAATLTFSHFINQLAIKMEIQKLKLTQKQIMSPQPSDNQKERLKRNNSSKNAHANLKNFDRQCNFEPNGFSNHRKHPTLLQESRNVSLASPAKKKVNRRVTSQQIFKPIAEKPEEESLNGINQQKLKFSQASIPKINLKQMKIFKDSKVSGSRPSPTPTNEEMTFDQAKDHKQSNWDLKKRITCSTQENIDKFSDSYRRQSTIRWVQEPLAGEKSIIEDYHCLFAKSGINISRKTNFEEGYKFNI